MTEMSKEFEAMMGGLFDDISGLEDEFKELDFDESLFDDVNPTTLDSGEDVSAWTDDKLLARLKILDREILRAGGLLVDKNDYHRALHSQRAAIMITLKARGLL